MQRHNFILRILNLTVFSFWLFFVGCACESVIYADDNRLDAPVGILTEDNIFLSALPWSKKIKDRPFKQSEIFGFTLSKNVEHYREYNVDIVAWGGHPANNSQAIEKFCKKIRKAEHLGTKIGMKFAAKTDWRRFLDYQPFAFSESLVRNVHGKPIIIPQQRNMSYKGHPAYWFCSNSPEFKACVRENIKRGMACKPYGIMQDGPSATLAAVREGGCYCFYCRKLFKKFLKKTYTPDQLIKKGIKNIETFDLLTFHQQFAHKKYIDRPLYDDIFDFQTEQAVNFGREMIKYGISLSDNRIPVGANINPQNPRQQAFLLNTDYYFCETHMKADKEDISLPQTILIYKIGDSLGRPAVIMGHGWDHAYIKKYDRPGMLRAWIAEAYAFGHYFSAPYRLWAYSPKDGSHNYRPENNFYYSSVYKFITQNAALFDDYSGYADIALLYSIKQFQKTPWIYRSAARFLSSKNIPFDIIIVGDRYFDMPITMEQLSKYKAIFKCSVTEFKPDDKTVLNNYEKMGGKIVSDFKGYDINGNSILVSEKNVMIALRESLNRSKKSKVIHLLNKEYLSSEDSCVKKYDFYIKIPRKIFRDQTIRKISYHRPPSLSEKKNSMLSRKLIYLPETELSFFTDEIHTVIKVPQLDFWGVISIQ